MSIIQTFPFDNTANYGKVNTEVSGGSGRLALIDLPAQSFNQPFTSDAGFTYNNSVSEFVAGVLRQKDRTAANSVFGVSYLSDANPITSEANLNWHKSGALTATLNGAPIISGGKLVCTGTQGVYYAKNTSTIETIKFKYTPNYTTSPPANIDIIGIWNGTNNNDRCFLTHSLSGTSTLRITCFDSSGSAVTVTAETIGSTWSGVSAGTTYEFELVIDSVAGTIRVFIDGALHGTLTKTPWVRGTSASRYYVGASPVMYDRAEASFDDVIVFNNAQHTTGYAPGYSVADTLYGADTIDIPNFTYSGLGEIQTLDSLTTTEGNSPRYTVEGMYWNGSAWVVSDGSFAQANDKATLNANLASLDMTGQTVVSLQVVWNDSNTQMSVDDLTLGFTGQQYAAEGTLLTSSAFQAKDITSFTAFEVKPGTTGIRYILEVNGQDRYHTGIAWADSDGTYAQASGLAVIQANLATLLTVNSNIRIKIVLSGDQTETPEIDIVTTIYNYGGVEPAPPTICQVFGYLKDAEDQPVVGATVTVVPYRDDDEYKEAADRIVALSIQKTTDANGYFSFGLIISNDYEVVGAQPMQYKLTIQIAGQTLPISKNGGADILFEVPNQASLNLTDQIGAA